MSDESVSLELRSVVQRFNDSSEVLEQLRERLRLLALADETQSASAKSIGEASEQLREFAGEVEKETSALASAVAETKAAMEIAREFLQGTDLKAIREEVGRLTMGQTALQTGNTRVVELLELELAAMRTELGQVTQARQQLEANIAAVPDKTRRKLGL